MLIESTHESNDSQEGAECQTPNHIDQSRLNSSKKIFLED